MRKFHTIIIVTLIVTVSLVSILCCCLTGKAQADVVSPSSTLIAKQDKGSSDHCHSPNPQKTDSRNSQQCECDNVLAILTTKGFNLPDFVDSIGGFFDKALSCLDRIRVFEQKLAQNHVLQASTQIVKSDPPIYLQNSTLRL